MASRKKRNGSTTVGYVRLIMTTAACSPRTFFAHAAHFATQEPEALYDFVDHAVPIFLSVLGGKYVSATPYEIPHCVLMLALLVENQPHRQAFMQTLPPLPAMPRAISKKAA